MEILVCVKRVPDTAENEIEIAGERYAAKASLRPLYDPNSDRVKS